MSDEPRVLLHSITGVDVELRIAGPGSRSYAFIIDWHIRVIFALAWFFAGSLLFGGLSLLSSEIARPEGWYWVVILPSVGAYLLYHPILEIAMHGRTPGKRMAGVRIVSRTGDVPGAGALLVRNVFRLFDSLPFAYVIGLITVVFTNQHVRVGDMAAGTLLVHDRRESDASFGGLAGAAQVDGATSGLSPQAADLAQELLDRWSALDAKTSATLARNLIARIDPAAGDLSTEPPFALRDRLRALLLRGRPA